MTPIDEKPSRNEEEYFARANADAVKSLRAQLDAARQRLESESSVMHCPRCGGPLAERAHHNVKIDVCANCGGTWLDKGELEMLEHVDDGNVRRFISGLFGAKA